MKQLEKLYKRTELGQIQEWQMCIDGNKYYSIEGISGGTLTTNKPTVAVGLNIGKANETSPSQQALKEAQAKHKKKLEKGYSIDVKAIDNDSAYFEPMLCHKYEDYKEKVDFKSPVYVQPKLDGQRCIARVDGLWSRTGKPILSVPHIHKALKPLFDKDPKLIFDGELYCDKFKNDFNQIMHLVRQQKPTAQDLKDSAEFIQYWVYDLPSVKETFGLRRTALFDLLRQLKTNVIVYVETVGISTQRAMNELYEKWIDAGYEGQIVRLDTVYENKRSRNILKRKEFITAEYVIVEVCEGLGNKSGMAGYMVLKLKDTTFKSNIKGSHILMEKIWKNRKNYVGKTATCKFFQLTPDGVPRFPYIIDIDREDFE